MNVIPTIFQENLIESALSQIYG